MTTTIHGLVGYAVASGAFSFALGGVLWALEHHMQRVTAWCFAIGAACFTVAIPPLFDAIAALTSYGPGLTILAVLLLVVGVLFHQQAIRTHKVTRVGAVIRWIKRKTGKGSTGPQRPNRHRRVMTPVVSVVAGILFVVVVGGWRLLAKGAGKSAKGTLAALTHASKQVNNGKAAAALPAHERPTVYVFAVAAVVAFAIILAMIERRRKGGGKPGKGARGAIGGGAPRPAIGG